VDLPVQGNWSVTAYAVDTAGQQDTSTTGATASYPIYPGDQAPTVTQNLLAPTNGTVFTDGRIFISGRVEDDQAISRAEVAVVNSAGQYLSSGGTFGTTTAETWIRAFLNSPGSPGSNYSYTTQVVPAGTYTVRVRGVDQHGFTTAPTTDVTVTVQVPASNPPVAKFSVVCGAAVATGIRSNTCEFDGRESTDENPTGLTYAWNFGTTPASTGTGAVVRKTFTAAAAYTVTLTAKDEYGNLSTPVTQTVSITEPADNVAPTAVISEPACTALVCNFSSASSADSNVGDTITRLWNWGDGTATSTATSGSHTFAAAGSYTVTLTVTDGWGKATTVTRSVTVTSP
jgi:PKD repeat protein